MQEAERKSTTDRRRNWNAIDRSEHRFDGFACVSKRRKGEELNGFEFESYKEWQPYSCSSGYQSEIFRFCFIF